MNKHGDDFPGLKTLLLQLLPQKHENTLHNFYHNKQVMYKY